MADRPFYTKVLYQNLEEVLSINVVYVERDAVPFSGQGKCESIARDIAATAVLLVQGDVAALGVQVYGCEVSTPAFEGAGSARYQRFDHASQKGGTWGDPLPDSITANVAFLTAGFPQGPVTGGTRLSIMGKNAINCNTFADDQQRVDLGTTVANMFPQILTGNFGPFDLAVESNVGGQQRFASVFGIQVSAIIGSDRQRIPNRPQKRGRPVAAAAATKGTMTKAKRKQIAQLAKRMRAASPEMVQAAADLAAAKPKANGNKNVSRTANSVTTTDSDQKTADSEQQSAKNAIEQIKAAPGEHITDAGDDVADRGPGDIA